MANMLIHVPETCRGLCAGIVLLLNFNWQRAPIIMPKKDDTTYVENHVLLQPDIIMWLLDTKKVTLTCITH